MLHTVFYAFSRKVFTASTVNILRANRKFVTAVGGRKLRRNRKESIMYIAVGHEISITRKRGRRKNNKNREK